MSTHRIFGALGLCQSWIHPRNFGEAGTQSHGGGWKIMGDKVFGHLEGLWDYNITPTMEVWKMMFLFNWDILNVTAVNLRGCSVFFLVEYTSILEGYGIRYSKTASQWKVVWSQCSSLHQRIHTSRHPYPRIFQVKPSQDDMISKKYAFQHLFPTETFQAPVLTAT